MSETFSIATSIVRKLFENGFIAYFAGGWVRDYLRGHISDEIDIATSAPPEKIIELFPKTVPVGIAFGVIVVVEGGKNFEVTTFRKDHPYHDGRHPEGVDFSTPEKDAQRRDFTINGMFYDPLTDEIHDFVGGKTDLANGIIRAIGNPEERFTEDRLRMIRAVRFSARFGFPIEKSTRNAIHAHASMLFPAVSMERIWQELTKMSYNPHFDRAILTLHEMGLLQMIFPALKEVDREELERRIQFYPYFPLSTPTIVYLLELFPNASLETRIELCHYLKTSHHEVKIVEFFSHSESFFEDPSPQDVTWAHFYAHPLSNLFLQIQEAKLPVHQRIIFFETHQKRQEELKTSIERIKNKHPLVNAKMLMEKGIRPGKLMGNLLREAERISVNQRDEDPASVLRKLEMTALWKNSFP